jgi:hypothetical protein
VAAASINHNGAMVSIKPTILKEAGCFLLAARILVTQIEDFIFGAASRQLLHQ